MPPFGSNSERKDVLTNNPFPGVGAFEPPRLSPQRDNFDLNDHFENLAHKRSSKGGVDFNRYASRKNIPELEGQEGPDSGDYQHVFMTNLEQKSNTNMGAMKFNLRPKREVGYNPEPIKRLVYDSEKVTNGLSIINALQIKGNVDFDKHTLRDHKMFKFDKEDVKEVERQVHPKSKL